MSDVNYKEQLNKILEEVNEKKLEQARLKERQKTLTEEKTKIMASLEELGIFGEEELKAELEKIEKEIQEGLEKCQTLLK